MGASVGRRFGGSMSRRGLRSEWVGELETLSEVAHADPQGAYSLLTRGVVAKWRFLMRTTRVDPACYLPLESELKDRVIPLLLGTTCISDETRDRTALPCRFAGLGIPKPTSMCLDEYRASRELTGTLTNIISARNPEDEGRVLELLEEDRTRAKALRAERERQGQAAVEEMKTRARGRGRVALQEITAERGRSAWLSAVPKHSTGVTMSPYEWRVNALLRLDLEDEIEVPESCPSCGGRSTVGHLLKCPCGPSMKGRHEDVLDELSECLTDAKFWVMDRKDPKMTTDPDEKQLFGDLKVRGLLNRGRNAFMDVRVIDTGSGSRLAKDPRAALLEAEKQKRRKYVRAARSDNADFSPFVLSVYGSFAPGANFLLKTIAERMSGGKDAREYGPNLFLLRARVQAAVLRGVSNCIGGRSKMDRERAGLRKRHRHDTHSHLIGTDAGWQ